jgi:hypothetical protein
MVGRRKCRARDIIRIKMDFVETVFEGRSWKIKVPNYDERTTVLKLTAESRN